MELRVRWSLGNLASEFEGRIDTADLPRELGQRAESVLLDQVLMSAAQAPEHPGAADMEGCEIDILSSQSSDGTRTYTVGPDAPASVIELVDELKGRILEEKRRSLRQS